MRLNVSDAEIARQITNDPSFKGPTGQFDRARFEQIIRGAGYTEPRFTRRAEAPDLAARDRRDGQRRDDAAEDAWRTRSTAIENEQRAIDYVVLDRAKAGDIAAPTPEAIAKYFEDHKAEFRAPEYRTIVVMSVTPADLAKPGDVSDADAKSYYDTKSEPLRHAGAPPDRADRVSDARRGAGRRRAAGESELSFEALAKERGLSEKDIDLGFVTKAGIIDRPSRTRRSR